MKTLLAAAFICISAPVLAQDRMERDECVQSWGAVFSFSNFPDVQQQIDVDSSGWCQIQNGVLNIDIRTRLHIETFKWRASEVERLIEEGLPPRSLEVYGEGLRVIPQSGDAVYDYLLEVQLGDARIDFGGAVRWDGVQNAVVVDEGFVVFDETNRVDVTGRIDGVDLTDQASIQSSLGTAGLENFTVKAEFDGWFEHFLAVPFGVAVLTDSVLPPEQQVGDLQGQAINLIGRIPETVFPDVTRDALSQFITALPKPRGTLQVQLNAEPAIGMERLSPLGFTQTAQDRLNVLPDVLDGVRVLVTWSPTRE